MKNCFLILVFIVIQGTFAQTKTTTYYFIRHAEKADDSKNPNLSPKGIERATLWSKIFSDINFDAVYSTDFNRTIQTATPVVTNKHLAITIYNPKTIDFQEFKKETLGKIILIVGHSNSTPEFVNKIINQIVYPTIEDSTFGNLYIVIIKGDFITYQLLKLP